METTTKESIEALEAAVEEVADTSHDRRDEIDELLQIKQSRRIDTDRAPCPCCGVVVEIAINRCPFCESDIAAENALARETMRRLGELSGDLDGEHAARNDEPPARRSFGRRLRDLFAGDPQPQESEADRSDPHARRLLSNVSPGDSLKVLAEDGPWLKVKTIAGDTGWVYSTMRKDR